MFQTSPPELTTWQTLLASFLAFLPKILAALVVFVVSIYLANLISRILQRYMEKRRVDPGMTVLLTLITRWGLVLTGTVAALRQVDFRADRLFGRAGHHGLHHRIRPTRH